jgi:hypothetical protein
MCRMPDWIRCFCLVVCLPLIVSANPPETKKSGCKSRISHSGFAEFVMPREGGTHELAIKADTSAKWKVRNDAYVDWISILDGDTGTGPGTLTIQLEPNPGRFCRVGELTILGIVPIYGLPIRILQEGTGAVGEDKPKEAFPSVIDLAPFASGGSKTPPKREYRPATKRP